jgi:hypothetical protein
LRASNWTFLEKPADEQSGLGRQVRQIGLDHDVSPKHLGVGASAEWRPAREELVRDDSKAV